MNVYLIILFLSCYYKVYSKSNQSNFSDNYLYFNKVILEIGDNIGIHVKNRIISYLSNIPNIEFHYIEKYHEEEHSYLFHNNNTDNKKTINSLLNRSINILFLSLGNTSFSLQHIPLNELNKLPAESYYIKYNSYNLLSTSNNNNSNNNNNHNNNNDNSNSNNNNHNNNSNNNTTNIYYIVSNGLPLNQERHRNISFNKLSIHYGAVLGAYVTLEYIGFGFFHPLQPYIPSQIRILKKSTSYNNNNRDNSDDNNSTTNNNSSSNNNTTTISNNNTTIDMNYMDTIIESPYWPERGFHLHTQHPIEVTEVLQGHDIPQFGPHGPNCKKHSKIKPLAKEYSRRKTLLDMKYLKNLPYCERWEDMVVDVDYMFEWIIANRLNKIEWLLLGSYKWGDELGSRLRRLRIITDLGHRYSLLIGVDVPIGNTQQHGWYMVDVGQPIKKQEAQIKHRVDILLQQNFDFITTESGLSEFTHPECDLMLELLNIFAIHVNVTWGREAMIKVHCSTGQTCKDYIDPRTGNPINFNFLPTYSHSSMGVFPHTVQMYSFDDPTSGSYGNQNFSYIEDYLVYEAKLRNRSVVYYGETAYWVNVDIDVPLFLPIYGQRRQYDLRKIALRELKEDFRIDGQMNFDSGWEYGYWLSDVITARASWNPHLFLHTNYSTNNIRDNNNNNNIQDNIKDIELHSIKDSQWEAFALSLYPITNIFGTYYSEKINNILVNLTRIQSELLIFGRLTHIDTSTTTTNNNNNNSHTTANNHANATPIATSSKNMNKLSGIAYMSGGDTWVDVPRLFGLHLTQADQVRMKESSDPDWHQVQALLTTMNNAFTEISNEIDMIYNDIVHYTKNFSDGDTTCSNINLIHTSTCNSNIDNNNIANSSDSKIFYDINEDAIDILLELKDCIKLLALRSLQLRQLYKSKDPMIATTNNINEVIDLQRQSRNTIHQASLIIQQREEYYRTPIQRIASWRENPTVYRFTYLWAVHSLYYWWRDQGLAEQGSFQSEHSPCYLNRMDVSEVAIGWGKYSLEIFRTFINRYTPFQAGSPLEIVNCLSPPGNGYEFPKDLYSNE